MAAGYDGNARDGGSGRRSIINYALLGPEVSVARPAVFALDRLGKCCEHKLLF